MSYISTSFQTNSRNIVTIAGIADSNGILQTSANTSCTVGLSTLSGTVLLTPTVMTYISPGIWSYTPSAALWPSGAALLVTVTVYDQTGVAPIRATFDSISTPLPLQFSHYRRLSIEGVSISGLVDTNNTLQTAATASAYLSIVNQAGSVVFASAAMTYLAPGSWFIDVPAAVLLIAQQLQFILTVYDQTGSSGVQRWQQTIYTLDGG